MEKELDFMLTTYDNPYDPFEEFTPWFKMDLLLGHNCCQLLANESNTNEIASDEVNDKEIITAMDRIVEREPTIYKKISKEMAGAATK